MQAAAAASRRSHAQQIRRAAPFATPALMSSSRAGIGFACFDQRPATLFHASLLLLCPGERGASVMRLEDSPAGEDHDADVGRL
jgi:hypothetical protein